MEEDIPKLDTSIAVFRRMKEADIRIGMLLEKIKQNPKDLCQWTLSVGNDNNDNNTNNSPSDSKSSAFCAIQMNINEVHRKMIFDFKQELKQQQKQQQSSSSSSSPSRNSSSSSSSSVSSSMSITEVENFCNTHSSWNSLPKYCSDIFFKTIREIFQEVGPVLPSDFVAKNKMMPNSIYVPRNLQQQQLAQRAKLLDERTRFVRESGVGLVSCLFSCCSASSATSQYEAAVRNYNTDYIRHLLLPAELHVTATDSEEEANTKKFSLPTAILSRGQCLFRGVQRGWLPTNVVCSIATPLLVGFQTYVRENNLGENNNNNSSIVEPTSSSSLRNNNNSNSSHLSINEQFDMLIRKFKALENYHQNKNNNSNKKGDNNDNNNGKENHKVYGDASSFMVPVSPQEEGTSSVDNNNNNENPLLIPSNDDDIWRDYQAFTHIMATAHFHCTALDERWYPRYISASSAAVSQRVKKIVWSIRKGIVSNISTVWSNYAVDKVNHFIEEAHVNAMLKLTGANENDNNNSVDENPNNNSGDEENINNILKIKVAEPSHPIRPSPAAVVKKMNEVLDNFQERYRELISTAVRLTRDTSFSGGGSSNQIDYFASSPTSPPPASSSASSATSATSTGTSALGDSSDNNNSSSSSLLSCCGYCTRGLRTALTVVIPEQSDSDLCRILQTRLRQKMVSEFVCEEGDKEIVRQLFSESAQQVWHLALGGDLCEAEKKYLSENENENSENNVSVMSSISQQQQQLYSPAAGDSSNDEQKQQQNSSSPSRNTNNNNINNSSTAIGVVVPDQTCSSLKCQKSFRHIQETFDRAKNRVIWHASAEMTRITDAFCEEVANRRCPRGLNDFLQKHGRKVGEAAQPHLLLYANALMTVKEIARLGEVACRVGTQLGGPFATGLTRNNAKVIELSRTLDQLHALLKKFPRENLEKNPELDYDSGGDDNDNDENKNAGDTSMLSNQGDQQDSFGAAFSRSNNSSGMYGGGGNNNDAMRAFGIFGEVMPFYRINQSWELYHHLIQSII